MNFLGSQDTGKKLPSLNGIKIICEMKFYIPTKTYKVGLTKKEQNFPYYSFTNNAFSSLASDGFILPPSINRTCLLRRAPSYNFISSSVSGTSCGTARGLPFGSSATKVKY